MIKYKTILGQLFGMIENNPNLYYKIFGKPPSFVLEKFKVIDTIKGEFPSFRFKVRIKKKR